MDILQELPEEIFRDIILRVPYKSQSKIKRLLKPAKEMIDSMQFYKDRINLGLVRKYICFLEDNRQSKYNVRISIYDPADQSYKRLPRIRKFSDDYKIFSVNHKIVVLGVKDSSTPILLIYDLLSNTWKCGAEFPNPDGCAGFACCASPDGSIYIAGGYNRYGGFYRELREAAVYNVDEDKWDLLPEMPVRMASCRGVFIEGMFYVISNQYYGCPRFDPRTRVWTIIKNITLPSKFCDVLYAFGRLIAYGIDGIEQYDWEGNVWRELEPPPQQPIVFVRATAWCDRIFFCGNFGTVRTYNITLPPKFYVYKPGAAFSERWISDDEPKFFLDTDVRSITTIEI